MDDIRTRRGPARSIVARALLLLLVLACAAHLEPARADSPFGAIVTGNPPEYASYQVKVTYTGRQTVVPPSILLVGSARSPALAEFTPHQAPGVAYGNDAIAIDVISVSGSTIEKIVNALASRPELQVSGGTTSPTYSLMIERGNAPGEIVFEHLATYIEASEIATILQGAVRAEPQVTRDVVTRFKNRSVGP